MWNQLGSGRPVRIDPGGVPRPSPPPSALLPGSFNPLHRGHTCLAAAATERLGAPVEFELSTSNVDKPELPRGEIDRRIAQFADVGPVWVTRAATFAEKAALFPSAAFVVGWDTAVRLIDPRYYGGVSTRDAALRVMLVAGNRFVVGGRVDTAGVFRVWDSSAVPEEFAGLFLALTEADFRVDVSSSELRAGGKKA